MSIHYVRLPALPRSPVARVLATVVAVLSFAVLAVFGAALLLVGLAVFVLAAVLLSARLWWLRRRHRAGFKPRSAAASERKPAHTGAGQTLDGDFRVIAPEPSSPPR